MAVDSDGEEEVFSDDDDPAFGTRDPPDEKELVALLNEICL